MTTEETKKPTVKKEAPKEVKETPEVKKPEKDKPKESVSAEPKIKLKKKDLKSPQGVDESRGISHEQFSKEKVGKETEKASLPSAGDYETVKKTKKKDEKTGIAYISSSSNNTIVNITDLAGNTISRVSGGMVTKHSRLKANPTIAMFVAKRAAERALDLGFTSLYIRMKGKTRFGHGPGANAAVKSLGKAGFNIITILDTTKFPRGGPKKKGGRRGRRG